MHYTASFSIPHFDTFKQQLLSWASQFSSCCFLDNHGYQSPWQQQECLVAAGTKASISAPAGQALTALQQFIDNHTGQWFFGHLSFGLFAETEGMTASRHSEMGFDDLTFFVPEIVVKLAGNDLYITAENEVVVQAAFDAITHTPTITATAAGKAIQYKPSNTKEQYLQTIAQLQQHILRGDCYEINYCQEFVAEDVHIQPVDLYRQLSLLSPNPFACFYKQGAAVLACASPERFLRRVKNQLLSQPIKGTAVRYKNDSQADEAEKEKLRYNEKDRRENVMVVDLVRNDLAKVCTEGTVKVEELFGIYSYPQVHQMISTVVGEARIGTTFTDILRATFPMGSMTGAPKKRVLQLIEQYEQTARGLFSGSVGYIQPNGDFDFNVVIRSVQYQQESRRLSFHVGSGITNYSQPQLEYEECLWKAAAIQQVLQN